MTGRTDDRQLRGAIRSPGWQRHRASRSAATAWRETQERHGRQKGHSLAIRLRDFRTEAMRFLRNPLVPPPHNTSEQNLRQCKSKQRASGSFRMAACAFEFMISRRLIETGFNRRWHLLRTLSAAPSALCAGLIPYGPIPDTRSTSQNNYCDFQPSPDPPNPVADGRAPTGIVTGRFGRADSIAVLMGPTKLITEGSQSGESASKGVGVLKHSVDCDRIAECSSDAGGRIGS